MRIELSCARLALDGRGARIIKKMAGTPGCRVKQAAVLDVYILQGAGGFTTALAEDVFLDPVAQKIHIDRPGAADILPEWNLLVEVTYKAGVANPEALTAREAAGTALGTELAADVIVQTARQYAFVTAEDPSVCAEKIASLLYNPLIERAQVILPKGWEQGERFPAVYPHKVAESPVTVRTITLDGRSDAELEKISRARMLSMSLEEIKAVRGWYAQEDTQKLRAETGLPSDPTDVELEMIAQTWSEHCKHKIFSAVIEYNEDGKKEVIHSLFATYIKKTTELLAKHRPDLRSVFHDNSGVVDFDEDTLVCIKAETHNSPSALDPYGGAITGIVGVNRDILGTGIGARPIFNTNVLCFGEPDTPRESVPRGLIHPREVLSGVHHGIVDGGNQSGIPVVAGAFLFDESFTGKPLVFCGTGGVLPAKVNGRPAWEKRIEPGDLAVVAGGRVGKDGIHGATFSSAALDEESPTSAVQIGDPMTQKKLTDFLLEAQALGLYKGITDNGAGGISSSLGEMAQTPGGVRIELDKCPLKYSGLAPWEILVSESQERMSFAVAPSTVEEFISLAKKRGVEAVVAGQFTDSGFVEIVYQDKTIGLLSLDFLHAGLPEMRLKAEWKTPQAARRDSSAAPGTPHSGDAPKTGPAFGLKEILLKLLAEPNIASKESLIRQYDHEVQAGSVIKPFAGVNADSPTDGGVFRPRYDSPRGLTITHGICPRLSELDTYDMAVAAVDEAYRAHIALGGDPQRASALDNFCWPDPVQSADTPDGTYKLAQLVRACKGLRDACLAYNLPLISGKDSMKNDARIGGKKVSVKPTLLVTVMGIIPDCSRALTPDFKRAGDFIYLLGRGDLSLGGSFYEKVLGSGQEASPKANPAEAVKLYRAFYAAASASLAVSCHDISDGGLAVSLAESCLGGRLGAKIILDGDALRELFSEAPSRLVASVKPENAAAFESLFGGLACRCIGKVSSESRLEILRGGSVILRADLDEIENAWKSFSRSSL
jgi:phosphoribosylformylglycinamidine synthase